MALLCLRRPENVHLKLRFKLSNQESRRQLFIILSQNKTPAVIKQYWHWVVTALKLQPLGQRATEGHRSYLGWDRWGSPPAVWRPARWLHTGCTGTGSWHRSQPSASLPRSSGKVPGRLWKRAEAEERAAERGTVKGLYYLITKSEEQRWMKRRTLRNAHLSQWDKREKSSLHVEFGAGGAFENVPWSHSSCASAGLELYLM